MNYYYLKVVTYDPLEAKKIFLPMYDPRSFPKDEKGIIEFVYEDLKQNIEKKLGLTVQGITYIPISELSKDEEYIVELKDVLRELGFLESELSKYKDVFEKDIRDREKRLALRTTGFKFSYF